MSNYLIDEILMARQVHLLAGPSGAGKTRWLLNMLLEWEKGRSVFGRASHPVPWCYVASDRNVESVHETLRSMAIAPEWIPIVGAFGPERKTWMEIMTAAAKRKAQLLVIESFGSFVEAPGLQIQVKNFMNTANAVIQPSKEAPEGMTIIGVMESPKMHAQKYYENPRQRVSGVASWAHFAETVMLVEFQDAKDPTSDRVLTICPRNSRALSFVMTFDGMGRPQVVPEVGEG